MKVGYNITRILLTAIIWLLPVGLSAQKAVVKNVRIVQKAVEDGVRGLCLYVDFDIDNAKGHDVKILCYFESPKETPLKDKNNRYNTKGGHVVCSKNVKPAYVNTTYTDCKLFMPYSELHTTTAGRRIYIDTRIQDLDTREFVDRGSFYVSFILPTLTSSGSSSHSHSHSHSSTAKAPDASPRYYPGGGVAYGPTNSPNAEEHVVTCSNCQGKGSVTITNVCLRCGGTGRERYTYYEQSYYGPVMQTGYRTCTVCGGAGKNTNTTKCLMCNGTGKCVHVKPKVSPIYNGNTSTGSSGYSGGYTGGSGSYGSGTTPSTPSTKSSRTTCPTCHGTGVCSSCHGSGGKWMETGYYIGTNEKSWIPCSSCNGSKRCYMCYGKGYL